MVDVKMAAVFTSETFINMLNLNNQSSYVTDLDRPCGLQEAEAPRSSRQSAHEGGKVVSP